jgi:hypothetical protein
MGDRHAEIVAFPLGNQSPAVPKVINNAAKNGKTSGASPILSDLTGPFAVDRCKFILFYSKSVS